MKPYPIFTIATVTWNAGQTVGRTLHSVEEQTYHGVEHLIIDGCSSDDTMQEIQRYVERNADRTTEHTVRLVREPDNGLYDAMNKGCALATGEVTGILNSDDWYEEGCLAAVDEAFKRTDFDVFYADLRMVEIKPDGSEAPLFIKKARNRSYMTSRDWNHPTTFIRTELYRTYRYRTETLHDDYDLILRLKRAGARFETENKVLADFRMNGVSHKRNLKRALISCRTKYRIYRENGYSPFYFFECFGVELAKLFIG